MLRGLKELEGYTVAATDGEMGKVANFLFDDCRWVVRYLVVETGGFFDGRRMIISPISFRAPDWETRRFHLALTKEKIRSSPGIDSDKPVSRQHERDYLSYYGYPFYWGGAGLWGRNAYPGLLASAKWDKSHHDPLEADEDVHLRSINEVRGYDLLGSDGGLGHIVDLIVDDETWSVRYLVIDTSNWWFGKKVLVAPGWATSISWQDRLVRVALSKESIRKSPQWNAKEPIDRDYETRLYDHYRLPLDGNSSAPVREHRPAGLD